MNRTERRRLVREARIAAEVVADHVLRDHLKVHHKMNAQKAKAETDATLDAIHEKADQELENLIDGWEKQADEDGLPW